MSLLFSRRILFPWLGKPAPGRCLSTATRSWIMKQHFKGMPTLDDFELKTGTLPALKDRQILIQPEFWSVDPYQRIYPSAFGFRVPMTMLGSSVSAVLESRHPDFPVGSHVVSYTGWHDTAVLDPTANYPTYGKGVTALPKVMKAIELPAGVSRSHLLGCVGMPGNSAYFGLLDLCQPMAGETVLVSGAAGGVGSLVGQIAKVKGCRVVGLAGSDAKCSWLRDELGFDAAINYKRANLKSAIRRAAPKGVDCYFDNVGGRITQSALTCMNMHGRIAVCGAIAGYNNAGTPELYPDAQPYFVSFQLRMEGFMVWRWLHNGRWNEGLAQLGEWLAGGRIKAAETVVPGFENLPNAFIGLLSGDNLGKMVVSAQRAQ